MHMAYTHDTETITTTRLYKPATIFIENKEFNIFYERSFIEIIIYI